MSYNVRCGPYVPSSYVPAPKCYRLTLQHLCAIALGCGTIVLSPYVDTYVPSVRCGSYVPCHVRRGTYGPSFVSCVPYVPSPGRCGPYVPSCLRCGTYYSSYVRYSNYVPSSVRCGTYLPFYVLMHLMHIGTYTSVRFVTYLPLQYGAALMYLFCTLRHLVPSTLRHLCAICTSRHFFAVLCTYAPYAHRCRNVHKTNNRFCNT